MSWAVSLIKDSWVDSQGRWTRYRHDLEWCSAVTQFLEQGVVDRRCWHLSPLFIHPTRSACPTRSFKNYTRAPSFLCLPTTRIRCPFFNVGLTKSTQKRDDSLESTRPIRNKKPMRKPICYMDGQYTTSILTQLCKDTTFWHRTASTATTWRSSLNLSTLAESLNQQILSLTPMSRYACFILLYRVSNVF